MTKTMVSKMFKWLPGSWNSSRPLDFEELLGFGNSDFENLDLFRMSDLITILGTRDRQRLLKKLPFLTG